MWNAITATANVIRRRWLDNDYVGGVFQGSRTFEDGGVQFGLGAFHYAGEHFGNPIWMEAGGQSLGPQHRYYDNLGEKSDRYGFIGGDKRLADDKINLRGEIQMRQIRFSSSSSTSLKNHSQTAHSSLQVVETTDGMTGVYRTGIPSGTATT